MSEAFEGMMVTPSVKLVRPLGEGGMGAVWIAEHLALHTQVVVKFIASGLKDNKEAQERFSREAAAASQVKSPHVVQTFDHGITDAGIPYIVMELLEGRDLGDYLDLQPRVSPELVVEIIGQLARALDRAHEKGIIHRDIKPGNVYLTDAGRDGEVFVKLLDFGIAKGVEHGGLGNAVDSGTKTGSMIGSPFYMSPEQILGSKDIDHRSDLWSVGVLAFEMLTGRKPFDAETMGGLAIRIHSEPLPMPTVASPGLPVELDAWFARACARDVNERFGSAQELTDELARALGGQAPRSRGATPRISVGGGQRRADDSAPTLAAGAATDAGVTRPSAQSRSRGRLLVLLAIFVIVPPIAYVGLRAIIRTDKPTALVPADPSLHRSAAAGGASAGPTGSVATTVTSVPSADPPPETTASAAAPEEQATAVAVKPTVTKPHRGGHGRPRPTGHASAHSVSPPPLPSPPVTSTATTPRPAPSGHDIF